MSFFNNMEMEQKDQQSSYPSQLQDIKILVSYLCHLISYSKKPQCNKIPSWQLPLLHIYADTCYAYCTVYVDLYEP